MSINDNVLAKVLQTYKDELGTGLSAEDIITLAESLQTYAEDNLLSKEQLKSISKLANSFFAISGESIIFRNRNKNDLIHLKKEIENLITGS